MSYCFSSDLDYSDVSDSDYSYASESDYSDGSDSDNLGSFCVSSEVVDGMPQHRWTRAIASVNHKPVFTPGSTHRRFYAVWCQDAVGIEDSFMRSADWVHRRSVTGKKKVLYDVSRKQIKSWIRRALRECDEDSEIEKGRY